MSSADAEERQKPDSPRGAGCMAFVRWLLVLGMTAFASVVVMDYYGYKPWGPESEETPKPEMLWHCPMHTQYVANQQSGCPICGMDLVLIPPAAATSSPAQDQTQDHIGDQVSGLAMISLSPERIQKIGVKTQPVQKRKLSPTISLLGYVTPDETKMSQVHARLSGWLQKLHVDETGQRVKKGDPLFTLFSKELYQAEREFILTRKNNKGLTSQDTANELSAVARRRLELLEVPADEITRLEKTGVAQDALMFRAPASGHILRKNAVEGKFVTPSDALYTIADLSRIWVLAEVYEKDISRINVGQNAILTVDALPAKQFEGKVTFLYPTLSPQTRTMQIRLAFDNPALDLRPGMYAQALVSVQTKEVLAAPEDAVVDTGLQQYAFIARDDGHFQPRLLQLGLRHDGWVEILSGVSEGDKIVVSAGFFIDSESRLKAAVAGMGSAEKSQNASGMKGSPP